jgi:Domain of unknown function (DUF4268)/T5orf172 domain
MPMQCYIFRADLPFGGWVRERQVSDSIGGYVYVLTNAAMPGIVKIGSTKLLPELRAQQLSTTGVPGPFKVIAYFRFENQLRAERELQAVFSRQRVHPRREFYEITIEEAQEALLQLAGGNSNEQRAPAPVPPADVQRKPVSNTNASVMGFPYWSHFNALRDEQRLLPRFENAGSRFFHRHFLVHPSKRNHQRNIHYEGRIRISSPQVSMRVIFKTADDIKVLFDLIEKEKDQIEREIGFALQWLRERGRYEAHIAIERDDLDPRNISEWDQQHEWLSRVVSGFEAVLRPRIAALPASPMMNEA